MKKKPSPMLVGVFGLLTLLAGASHAVDDRFPIARFQVEGNTLLSAAEVNRRVAPLAGPDRGFGDIQLAVQALQAAYVQAGYSTAIVSLPEQELTGGVVRIDVSEGVLGSIKISGNRHFGDGNIRASLAPMEQRGVPNLKKLSESIQLSNDNPAKQIGVNLSQGAQAGTVDANVTVTDFNPLRIIGTIDNTGTSSSGNWRTGVALQHANLFDRDHVGTIAYTTSPDKPSGMQMDLFSIGYRIPFYGTGDSFDLIYGKSNVNSPANSPTLGGVLGFTGKGDVYGLRWNHFLGREGESFSKLVFGLDRKNFESRCNIRGELVSIEGPTPPIAACVPYQTTPLSLSYLGQRDRMDETLTYRLGIARNLASGSRFTNVNGRIDRYSYLTPGNRDTKDGFMTITGAASFFKGLAGGWQTRLAGTAQYSNKPLLSGEQFSLTGNALVRGFDERVGAADSGLVVNAEIYTPELAGVDRLGIPGQLRLLAFFDAGHGRNQQTRGTSVPSRLNVSSAGVGARYAWTRDFTVRVDIARVASASHVPVVKSGDWRAHVSAVVAY